MDPSQGRGTSHLGDDFSAFEINPPFGLSPIPDLPLLETSNNDDKAYYFSSSETNYNHNNNSFDFNNLNSIMPSSDPFLASAYPPVTAYSHLPSPFPGDQELQPTVPAFIGQGKVPEELRLALEKKITLRPSRQDLEDRGIMKKNIFSAALDERHRAFERQHLSQVLNNFLSSRPGPLDLVSDGILMQPAGAHFIPPSLSQEPAYLPSNSFSSSFAPPPDFPLSQRSSTIVNMEHFTSSSSTGLPPLEFDPNLPYNPALSDFQYPQLAPSTTDDCPFVDDIPPVSFSSFPGFPVPPPPPAFQNTNEESRRPRLEPGRYVVYPGPDSVSSDQEVGSNDSAKRRSGSRKAAVKLGDPSSCLVLEWKVKKVQSHSRDQHSHRSESRGRQVLDSTPKSHKMKYKEYKYPGEKRPSSVGHEKEPSSSRPASPSPQIEIQTDFENLLEQQQQYMMLFGQPNEEPSPHGVSRNNSTDLRSRSPSMSPRQARRVLKKKKSDSSIQYQPYSPNPIACPQCGQPVAVISNVYPEVCPTCNHGPLNFNARVGAQRRSGRNSGSRPSSPVLSASPSTSNLELSSLTHDALTQLYQLQCATNPNSGSNNELLSRPGGSRYVFSSPSSPQPGDFSDSSPPKPSLPVAPRARGSLPNFIRVTSVHTGVGSPTNSNSSLDSVGLGHLNLHSPRQVGRRGASPERNSNRCSPHQQHHSSWSYDEALVPHNLQLHRTNSWSCFSNSSLPASPSTSPKTVHRALSVSPLANAQDPGHLLPNVLSRNSSRASSQGSLNSDVSVPSPLHNSQMLSFDSPNNDPSQTDVQYDASAQNLVFPSPNSFLPAPNPRVVPELDDFAYPQQPGMPASLTQLSQRIMQLQAELADKQQGYDRLPPPGGGLPNFESLPTDLLMNPESQGLPPRQTSDGMRALTAEDIALLNVEPHEFNSSNI